MIKIQANSVSLPGIGYDIACDYVVICQGPVAMTVDVFDQGCLVEHCRTVLVFDIHRDGATSRVEVGSPQTLTNALTPIREEAKRFP